MRNTYHSYRRTVVIEASRGQSPSISRGISLCWFGSRSGLVNPKTRT